MRKFFTARAGPRVAGRVKVASLLTLLLAVAFATLYHMGYIDASLTIGVEDPPLPRQMRIKFMLDTIANVVKDEVLMWGFDERGDILLLVSENGKLVIRDLCENTIVAQVNYNSSLPLFHTRAELNRLYYFTNARILTIVSINVNESLVYIIVAATGNSSYGGTSIRVLERPLTMDNKTLIQVAPCAASACIALLYVDHNGNISVDLLDLEDVDNPKITHIDQVNSFTFYYIGNELAVTKFSNGTTLVLGIESMRTLGHIPATVPLYSFGGVITVQLLKLRDQYLAYILHVQGVSTSAYIAPFGSMYFYEYPHVVLSSSNLSFFIERNSTATKVVFSDGFNVTIPYPLGLVYSRVMSIINNREGVLDSAISKGKHIVLARMIWQGKASAIVVVDRWSNPIVLYETGIDAVTGLYGRICDDKIIVIDENKNEVLVLDISMISNTSIGNYLPTPLITVLVAVMVLGGLILFILSRRVRLQRTSYPMS